MQTTLVTLSKASFLPKCMHTDTQETGEWIHVQLHESRGGSSASWTLESIDL